MIGEMTSNSAPGRDDEEFWRDFLTRGDEMERRVRGIFRRIPRGPRCQLCAAPFAGPGAPLMRMIGKRRSSKNPNMCNSCFQFMADHRGGADEVVAIFFPLLSGERHAARAVEAALALLRATGNGEPDGPWAPLGAGVHTGPAWVGAVGEGSHTELTALGDTVNTTARLASAAAAGEVLVTIDAASAAGLDPELERRSLELKGKQLTTEVISLNVSQ